MEKLLVGMLKMDLDPTSRQGYWRATKNGYAVIVFSGFTGCWEEEMEVTCQRDGLPLYKQDLILDAEETELSNQIKSEEGIINILRVEPGSIIDGKYL